MASSAVVSRAEARTSSAAFQGSDGDDELGAKRSRTAEKDMGVGGLVEHGFDETSDTKPVAWRAIASIVNEYCRDRNEGEQYACRDQGGRQVEPERNATALYRHDPHEHEG